MAYTVEQHSCNVATVHVTYEGELRQDFLLSADRHWDNVDSNWQLQKKHLQQAVDKGSGILDFGDLFCAMQGKFDKRSSKDKLRPIHLKGDYLDSLVDTATEFFSPYAQNMILLAHGNHETGILKRHETDLTNRLANQLNQKTGSRIFCGGYSGWIKFVFRNEYTQKRDIIKLWYIHGYGGGGPVTRGVIQSSRKAVYVPNADIVVSGHIHESWNMDIVKITLKDNKVVHEEQHHIQLPTYKDEYKDGYGGWHVEGGKPPKPVGAKWLKFFSESRDGPVTFDVSRAK